MPYGRSYKKQSGNRFRRKIPARKSRKLFSRTAKRVHPRNHGGSRSMMRGGIRL